MKFPKDRCQYVKDLFYFKDFFGISERIPSGSFWCDLSDNPCDPYTRGEGECETLEEQIKEEEEC